MYGIQFHTNLQITSVSLVLVLIITTYYRTTVKYTVLYSNESIIIRDVVFQTDLSDLQEDEEVEHGERGEGDDVHEDQVHPGDIDRDVQRVHPQISDHEHGALLAVLGDEHLVPLDLQEAGDVVHEGEGHEGGRGHLGPALGAHRARLQGPADH